MSEVRRGIYFDCLKTVTTWKQHNNSKHAIIIKHKLYHYEEKRLWFDWHQPIFQNSTVTHRGNSNGDSPWCPSPLLIHKLKRKTRPHNTKTKDNETLYSRLLPMIVFSKALRCRRALRDLCIAHQFILVLNQRRLKNKKHLYLHLCLHKRTQRIKPLLHDSNTFYDT